ncbi:MAG: metallophosphoesterase family protein [Desulfobacterales bacterium]|nr:MAG: metallophosphoesterase family protein [Desulfobacterales bacterium]
MTLLIGIMADSHGQHDKIEAALAELNNLSCQAIYHLGDACDSTHPESAETCLRPLQQHHVILIKGNNDHAIIASQIGRQNPIVAPEVLRYLQAAPLMMSFQNAIFTHSLPFADALGLSCMIGKMGQSGARRAFNEFPNHIIFRGHSHSPEIVRPRGRGIVSRRLGLGEKIDLAGRIPCVVTCGALTRGLYMVWNPQDNSIRSLALV